MFRIIFVIISIGLCFSSCVENEAHFTNKELAPKASQVETLLNKNVAENGVKMDALLKQGSAALLEGRIDQAVKTLKLAYELDSSNTAVIFYYANSLSSSGKIDLAIQISEKWYKKDTTNPKAIYLYGLMLNESPNSNDVMQAVKHISRFINSSPINEESINARLNLINSYCLLVNKPCSELLSMLDSIAILPLNHEQLMRVEEYRDFVPNWCLQ